MDCFLCMNCISFYRLQSKHCILCNAFYVLSSIHSVLCNYAYIIPLFIIFQLIHIVLCCLCGSRLVFAIHSRHLFQMHYISLNLFLQILIYFFYSLHIAFAYCSTPFASKLLYRLFKLHTIHHIICIIVHAYSSFIICNFAFDSIDNMHLSL